MEARVILNMFEVSQKLKVGLRKKVNAELIKYTTGTYFKAIPLKDLFSILKKHGIIALQEDNTEWSGLLAGNSETTSFSIAPVSSKVENMYQPYDNTVLVLQWYKMESGKYEITTYVS